MDTTYATSVIKDCYEAWQKLVDGKAGEDAAVAALTRNRRASLQGGAGEGKTPPLRGDLSGLEALAEGKRE